LTQYIYPNQTVIRCASYINGKRSIYVGQRVFVRVGESKKKANARVLEDVTSFLSNSTGSSNSSQQWGLKPPEETLVKNEVTGYNEG
jgi:hypothetical protein